METSTNRKVNDSTSIVGKDENLFLTPHLIGDKIIEYLDAKFEKGGEQRHLESIRLIVNFLFRNPNLKELTKNDEKKTENIEFLPEEELLLFTFFLSGKREFLFEWSYLLKKYDAMRRFLIKFNRYIFFVCRDISELIELCAFSKNTTFEIDNFLYIEVEPDNKISAHIEIDAFGNIFNCEKDLYQLKISSNQIPIITLNRSPKVKIEEEKEKITKLMGLIFPPTTPKHQESKDEGKV